MILSIRDYKIYHFEDCYIMNRSKLQCDKGMSGDKIESMLLNTEFEFLLKLRQV